MEMIETIACTPLCANVCVQVLGIGFRWGRHTRCGNADPDSNVSGRFFAIMDDKEQIRVARQTKRLRRCVVVVCPSSAQWLLVASFLLCAAATEAKASTELRHRLVYRSLTAFQFNPLGLQTDVDLGYRYRLYNSTKRIFGDGHLGLLAVGKVNPAYGRVGAAVVIQPLAILKLRFDYLYRGYFGTMGMLQSYSSPAADHSEDARGQGREQGINYATRGHELKAEVVLQAKYGPIAILNQLQVFYVKMNLQGSDRLFYDAYLDTLMPNEQPVIVNNAHLFYISNFGLTVGVRYSLVHAFYPSSWDETAAKNLNTPSHRVGPMAAYTFGSRHPQFQKPTIVVIVNWWLRNRYRTGQEISQAIPYGVLAFQFQGDIWGK